MSAAFYIVLEQENPGFDWMVNGKVLSRHGEELERVAKSLSVTPLMEFFSMSPDEIAGIMEDAGGDASTMDLEDEQWYEASAGLTTVRALRQYAAEHPDDLPDVESDLAEFEVVLKSAEAHGVKWHVAVDY